MRYNKIQQEIYLTILKSNVHFFTFCKYGFFLNIFGFEHDINPHLIIIFYDF